MKQKKQKNKKRRKYETTLSKISNNTIVIRKYNSIVLYLMCQMYIFNFSSHFHYCLLFFHSVLLCNLLIFSTQFLVHFINDHIILDNNKSCIFCWLRRRYERSRKCFLTHCWREDNQGVKVVRVGRAHFVVAFAIA